MESSKLESATRKKLFQPKSIVSEDQADRKGKVIITPQPKQRPSSPPKVRIEDKLPEERYVPRRREEPQREERYVSSRRREEREEPQREERYVSRRREGREEPQREERYISRRREEPQREERYVSRRREEPQEREETQRDVKKEKEGKEVAYKVVETIVDEMKKQNKDKFSVIEGMSDLGDISMAFLESPNVNKLVTFMSGEKNEMYRKKITENKFSSKIMIFDENFKYSPSVRSPYILFFNPSWLHRNIKTLIKDRLIPQLLRLTINEIPVTDIIDNENCDLLVFYIPVDVIVPNDSDIYETINITKDTKLFIVHNKEKKKRIQTITYKNPELIDKRNEKEWRKNLMMFLKEILIPSVGNEYVNRLLTEDVMDIWANAFTHETFDLNNNYEQLETIGDRVLELPFVKLILMRYPDLTSKEITLIKSHYLSKIFQGSTSRNLGFAPWIRIAEGLPTVSILEDTFESFFGALYEAAEKNLGPGFGYVTALNFLIDLFKDIEIDLTVAKGKPKSQIKEIFEKLQWGKGGPVESFEITENGQHIFKISLTDAAYQYLKNLNTDISKVIGVGYGASKTNAENNAYANALITLQRNGITWDWAQNQKEIYELTSPDFEPYINDALTKIEKDGFQKFEFFMSKTTTSLDNYIVQLIGVKYLENGKKYREILSSGRYSDIQNGKIDVLRKYVQNVQK